jgi:hypothetical protein
MRRPKDEASNDALCAAVREFIDTAFEPRHPIHDGP